MLTVSTACTKSSHTIIQISSLNLTTTSITGALVNCVGVSKSLTVRGAAEPRVFRQAAHQPRQPANQLASQLPRFTDAPPIPQGQESRLGMAGALGEPEAEV